MINADVLENLKHVEKIKKVKRRVAEHSKEFRKLWAEVSKTQIVIVKVLMVRSV